jgi:toxin-antitoxin system PIN domain toxin
MISFFPDLNVWLALTDGPHAHHPVAERWLDSVTVASRVGFSRYTQIGLIRLLTNTAVMGAGTLTLGKAWAVYERWLEDPRVEFYPEPGELDGAFREALAPFFGKAASKMVGDCYLLAYAKRSDATLVTFDKALFELARKHHCAVVLPA